MSGPRGWQIPSHACYADDIMIFCRASKQNLLHLMALFKAYGEASGQIISPAKCKFYPSSITPRRLGILANILGFSVGQHPFSYLGVPIFKCRPKKQHLRPITNIIKTKLASWKGSMLSIMGSVQLVKSVIQGMILYSFHVYARPVLLIKSVDSWIRNFIWFGDTSTKKIVTVAWSKVCTPYAAGGLGIRPLRGINDAALLKLCWQMFTSEDQWASFCRARFLRGRAPVSHYVSSSIWPSINRFFHTVQENTSWQLGDGNTINFWTNKWLSQPVVDLLSIPNHLHPLLSAKVKDFITNGSWCIP